MKSARGLPFLLLAALAVTVILAGCPLPFEYNGKGASSHSTDPSSPNMTSVVTVAYAEEGGGSGSIPDGGSFASGKTTTVTLSTASLNAVIFYTDDGTTLSDLRSAQKIDASSGSFTITRTTTPQSLDIHAVAVGPNMLPSPAVHFTVAVTPYPILTVTSSPNSIVEGSTNNTATFTITSSSPAASDITVNLKTGGDYSTSYLTGLPGGPNTSYTAPLASGTTTIAIVVAGIHDPSTASHTVTLMIQPDLGSTYAVGTPSSASLMLQDDASHGVTYNSNGGGTAPTDSNYYVLGATVTVAGSMVRTGYAFAGWNTMADGSGTMHAAGATFAMPGSDVTLYAIWNVIQYTLTVTSSGGGTTSPAGGLTVLYGAATAITATPGPLYTLISWTVTAGSGVIFGSTGNATSTSLNDTVSLTGGNATIQANFALNYYVNAVTGSDANPGNSPSAAFKTITKALSVAVSGRTIIVAAGVYDTTNGETFPFYIPAGVSLIGDEATKGAATVILGGGTTTVYDPSFISSAVVMGLNTVLAGFTVTNNSGLSGNPMGVLVHGGYSANDVIIRNNTIANNPSIGIYVAGGSGGIVSGNTTAANISGGLVFVGGGGNGMSVFGNTFNDLVELDTLGPDLGGGATGSPGLNSFIRVANPTYFGSGGTVYAMNNHWNNSPPTVGAWPGAFDVGIASGTTVITTGYY